MYRHMNINGDIFVYMYLHRRIYIYIFVCIIVDVSPSSSSCHATSTDLHDPLSPLLPIVYCFRRVFRVTSRIGTELLYVGSCRSSCLCSSMWRGPQEYITYEFILTSPAVSRMSGSSNFDSFVMGGRWPYSCCFVGCCLHELLSIAHSILF